MRVLPLVVLALSLTVVLAAPPAGAHVVLFRFDFSGDWDCNDPGEEISVPGPVHDHHALCHVLA